MHETFETLIAKYQGDDPYLIIDGINILMR